MDDGFDREQLSAIDEKFNELAELTQSIFAPYDRTPVAASVAQGMLRLQEAHMWIMNGASTISLLDGMREKAAEDAMKAGTIVNLTDAQK
jgi:hypothetical protein